ncbi:MAG: hypothetical protein JWR27_1470 [Aeromicrobium sp.]|nr:hypothetical protein [Aeromicrobium sp.]
MTASNDRGTDPLGSARADTPIPATTTQGDPFANPAPDTGNLDPSLNAPDGGGSLNAPHGGGSSDESSGVKAKAEDVKSTAQDAASSAADHGADVASTAKDEARQVASEAKDKATDLLADAKAQIDEQSRTQLQGLSSKLGELSKELDGMVEGSSQQGAMTDLARQLSQRTNALGQRLANRDPQDVLEDVRSFARQRPGVFIGGALVAGLVAGRLARGAKKAQSSDTQSSGTSSSQGTTAPDFAAPAPADTYGEAPLGQYTGGRQ